jgi:hypothetical protein
MKSYVAFALLQKKRKKCRQCANRLHQLRSQTVAYEKIHFHKKIELQINKRTKISEPSPEEITFDIMEIKKEESIEATVTHILSNPISSKFDILGRVTFQGPEETINSNGKVLVEQDAVLTDETDSIRMVLWQSDIKKFESSTTYNITNMVKGTYKDVPYITLTRDSIITTSLIVVQKEDKQLVQHQANEVS